jgi:hypothetical protein
MAEFLFSDALKKEQPPLEKLPDDTGDDHLNYFPWLFPSFVYDMI